MSSHEPIIYNTQIALNSKVKEIWCTKVLTGTFLDGISLNMHLLLKNYETENYMTLQTMHAILKFMKSAQINKSDSYKQIVSY